MSGNHRQSGFTMIELLVVMTTILILAGALLGVGRYLSIRASVQLCESQLEVLCTALEQYYDDYTAFPFEADTTYAEADLLADLDGTAINPAAVFGTLDNAAAASSALFFFLDRSPNSRKIIEAVSDKLITSKDRTGGEITIVLSSGETLNLPRFVDPWGLSIYYGYVDGTAFPTLVSAGPDKKFETVDDNIISP